MSWLPGLRTVLFSDMCSFVLLRSEEGGCKPCVTWRLVCISAGCPASVWIDVGQSLSLSLSPPLALGSFSFLLLSVFDNLRTSCLVTQSNTLARAHTRFVFAHFKVRFKH